MGLHFCMKEAGVEPQSALAVRSNFLALLALVLLRLQIFSARLNTNPTLIEIPQFVFLPRTCIPGIQIEDMYTAMIMSMVLFGALLMCLLRTKLLFGMYPRGILMKPRPLGPLGWFGELPPELQDMVYEIVHNVHPPMLKHDTLIRVDKHMVPELLLVSKTMFINYDRWYGRSKVSALIRLDRSSFFAGQLPMPTLSQLRMPTLLRKHLRVVTIVHVFQVYGGLHSPLWRGGPTSPWHELKALADSLTAVITEFDGFKAIPTFSIRFVLCGTCEYHKGRYIEEVGFWHFKDRDTFLHRAPSHLGHNGAIKLRHDGTGYRVDPYGTLYPGSMVVYHHRVARLTEYIYCVDGHQEQPSHRYDIEETFRVYLGLDEKVRPPTSWVVDRGYRIAGTQVQPGIKTWRQISY